MSANGLEVAGCLHFDYDELKRATNSFDTRPLNQGGCKLGEGGFGPVFRGNLKYTEVAIKILRNTPKVGEGQTIQCDQIRIMRDS